MTKNQPAANYGRNAKFYTRGGFMLQMRYRFSLLAMTFFLFASCTKKGSDDFNLDVKETLRVVMMAEPPTLDWQKGTDTTSSEVTTNLMDGLVRNNYDDPELKLVPALATKWQASRDQKTWTFTLRDDVKWTDGVPFTGQHVVDAWERLLNPATAAPYAYMLFNLKNAKKYNLGEITDFSQVGVKVNEKGQLVVELERAQSYFPLITAHNTTFPVRKDIVEKFGDSWTRPENIQTLGPFKLKVWENDRAVVLERNENYYGEKAKVKNVILRIVKEVSTALKMFEKGQVDALNEVPSLEVTRLKSLPGYHEQPVLGIYYLGMNVEKKPLDNVKVRKALSMAIDREEITKLLNGGQKPITGWLPLGMFGYNPDIGLKFDPNKAKKLLDEAGYKDRSRFPRLVAAFNTNENHQRLLENVQAQLKRNLGIQVELQNSEWKTYIQHLRADPPMIFRFGWIADFPDPDNFFSLITTESENNHTRWSNPKFDKLVKKAVSVGDLKERKRLYDEAHRLLVEDDVPVIPIYSYVRQTLVADRVVNFPRNAMQKPYYKQVSLK